jgi:thymidylate synthase ThyX
MISAEIIADSKSPAGTRITSFIASMPRCVLSEFNTHRMFSRNSASSRAVPFVKFVAAVQDKPFIPMKWMKEHKGMQGSEYFTDENDIKRLEIGWLEARNAAVEQASKLSEAGLTKQMCNRLLEPFMYHTVIVTATDYSNFFALRAHEEAEIHIQDLAYKMLAAYNESKPVELKTGQWHIPFGGSFSEERINQLAGKNLTESEIEMYKIKIATARCARVSYMNYEGKDDYKADVELYKRLASSGHFSPFEHCAMADNAPIYYGNFRGFIQLRKKVHYMEENKRDLRVVIQ